MKIGDKRPDNVVIFTGCMKTDILSCFDKLILEEEEEKLIDLQKKKRSAEEKAKKLF